MLVRLELPDALAATAAASLAPIEDLDAQITTRERELRALAPITSTCRC